MIYDINDHVQKITIGVMQSQNISIKIKLIPVSCC